MNEHFDMFSDKDIWDNEDAVEATPLFFRNFYPILDEIDQKVFKVRNKLFFILFTTDV